MATKVGFQLESSLASQHMTDAKFIKGGYLAVETIAERDLLPVATDSSDGIIAIGSICYVNADGKYYKYSGDSGWVEDLANISELNTKQPTLVSGTNIKTINGQNILGEGNVDVRTYQPYPDSWTAGLTNFTVTRFCQNIMADESAVPGMAYAGTITSTQFFPDSSMTRGEVNVQIMGSSAASKVILLTTTSSNHAPYHWELTYDDRDHGWKPFGNITDVQVNGTTVVSDYIANITTVDSVESTSLDPLSANMGKELNDRINNLESIGRFLSIWDAANGKPTSAPTSLPYTYRTGDYYRVGAVGQSVVYKHGMDLPSGTTDVGTFANIQFKLINSVSTEYTSVADIAAAVNALGYTGHVGLQAQGTCIDSEGASTEVAYITSRTDGSNISLVALDSSQGMIAEIVTPTAINDDVDTLNLYKHTISMAGTAEESKEYSVSCTIYDVIGSSYDTFEQVYGTFVSCGYTDNVQLAASGSFDGTVIDGISADSTTQNAIKLWCAGTVVVTVTSATTISDTCTASSAPNYQPYGSTYDGTASTVQYVGLLAVGDLFYYDGTQWILQKSSAGGSVQDVQIAGVSLVSASSGIATIPTATSGQAGVVKTGADLGVATDIEGIVSTVQATEAQLTAKTNTHVVVTPNNLDTAVKIGLSTNATTWTADEQSSARTVLDAQQTLVSTENIKSINGESLLGSGNIAIKTYQPFPNTFNTKDTVEDFVNSVLATPGAVQGMAYLGELECTDLPTTPAGGFGNVEATVCLMTDDIVVIEFTTGSDGYTPYMWKYNSFLGRWTKWSEVIANPTGDATQTLTKLRIDEVNYNLPVVDQTYSATSTNAQSGVAVASAISTKMDKVDPTGSGSLSVGRQADTTIGTSSVAAGYNVEASGSASVALGMQTNATGLAAVALGRSTTASGGASTALGSGTTASGSASVAAGRNSAASGDNSLAVGYNTRATGYYSTSIGYGDTRATYTAESASGSQIVINKDWEIDSYAAPFVGAVLSHSESSVEYYIVTQVSHVSDQYTLTLDRAISDTTNPQWGLVSGVASGNNAVSLGRDTIAAGYGSHAEGVSTTAVGVDAHAENSLTNATGDYSHAEGYGTIASGHSQHVAGKYNIVDTTSAEIIGNGTSDSARSNARTLDWSGNEVLAGNLQAAGLTDGTTTKTMTQVLSSVTGIPACPSTTDGIFILRAHVNSGVVTYEWILDTTLKTTETDGEYEYYQEGLGE